MVPAGTSDFFHPWKKSTRKKSALAILASRICLTPRRDNGAESAAAQRHDFLARYNSYAVVGRRG